MSKNNSGLCFILSRVAMDESIKAKRVAVNTLYKNILYTAVLFNTWRDNS